MALLRQTEIGLKVNSRSVEIPNNPTARLMYYLNSVCEVLNMNDNADINRLRRYQQYYLLSNQDRKVLIGLCLLLKPEVLINKCIFQNDSMCGDSSNKFYELEAVRKNLLVAGNVLIGGQNRQVTSIMAFKMVWLRNNYYGPLEALVEQQRREEIAEQQRQARIAEQQRQARIAEQQRQARIAEQRRQAEQSKTCTIL